MRVSLQIDGDAKGAEDAARAASAAVTDLGKQTDAISKAIEEGFKKATGSIEGLKNSSQSSAAANDNSASAALGLASKLSQVAAQAAGADSALAKGAAGAVSFAKGLGDAVRAVGAFNIVGALLGLAVTAATTFYGVVNSGSKESEQRVEEHTRLVGALRTAYSDASGDVVRFGQNVSAVTRFQAEMSLTALRADLARLSNATVTRSTFIPSQGLNDLPLPPDTPGAIPQTPQVKPEFEALASAIEKFKAGGVESIIAARNEVAELGRAAKEANPELAELAAKFLDETKSAGTTAERVKELGDALQGKFKGAAQSAGNELDRMIKSMSRQAAAQEAEAATYGKSAGEVAKLRAEYILTEAAQQSGGLTAKRYADIQAAAARAGAAAQNNALAAANDNVSFGAATRLLSPEDAAIAQQLRGIYPDVAEALDSVQAAGLRANTALGALSATTSGTLVSGIADMVDGTKRLDQGAADMAKSLIRSLNEMMIKAMIVAPIFRALQGAISGFGGFGSFLGGGASNATDGIGGFGPTAPGFDRGGYTGAGARHQAAGIVHRGEVVFSQDDVQRHGGVQAVESLRTMRGYDGGGPVGGFVSPWGMSRAASMAANNNPMPSSESIKVNVTNNGTPKEVEAQQVVDGRGNRSIELTLDDQQAAAISRPGSATGRAMANRFGARAVGVKR